MVSSGFVVKASPLSHTYRLILQPNQNIWLTRPAKTYIRCRRSFTGHIYYDTYSNSWILNTYQVISGSFLDHFLMWWVIHSSKPYKPRLFYSKSCLPIVGPSHHDSWPGYFSVKFAQICRHKYFDIPKIPEMVSVILQNFIQISFHYSRWS